MKLTEKKLKQLILETLSQAERDSIMQMIETGDEGNINQALELLEILGGDLEIAEALMRLPANRHTLERGWKMFSELASLPKPNSLPANLGFMMGLGYSRESYEEVLNVLRKRGWRETNRSNKDKNKWDFYPLQSEGENIIFLPIRDLPFGGS